MTQRQITRGIAAFNELGYLSTVRRGKRTTNLMVPWLDGGPLFPDAVMGPLGPRRSDLQAHGDVTRRSTKLSLAYKNKAESPFSPPTAVPANDRLIARGSLHSAAARSLTGHPWPEGVAEDMDAWLGHDVFQSWFTNVAIDSIGEKVVRLVAPSRFVANWINAHFQDALLACWQKQCPTIERVHVAGGDLR